MATSHRPSGYVVENSIGIAADAEAVFDYVTDVRREPEWNPQLREVEKLTPGPVGAGTRYRVRFGRGVGAAVIENIAFDRPREWRAVSRSRRLDVRFHGQVTGSSGGCRLDVRNELFPKGVLRLLSPVLRRVLIRSWDRDLAAIKAIVERGGGREEAAVRAANRVTGRVRRSLPSALLGGAAVRRAARVPVDRASPADLMQLAADVGPAPMHTGAVLVLGTRPGFNVDQARRLLGERIAAVPRLRQRLCRAPPGCGRPFWADDPAFDLGHHVRQVPCPVPGDQRALLDVATAVLSEPLPRSRPLWSATFVTGLAGGGSGLVIVMNHVLADGIGGLAVLGQLVDEGQGLPPGGPAAVPFPVPTPELGALAADAWAGRARRLAHPADSLRTIGQGVAELGGARPPRRLPRTSLNRPTGPRRRLDVVTADLAAVRGLGHEHGGTVNDVILAAVTAALRALLAGRGEQLEQVTVSVPVSARQQATGGQLGNQVGVMPVALPATGSLPDRITQIAAITRRRKTTAKGTSVVLLGPLFRLLAAAGLLRWFVNHQRLVHTFTTNLRGPGQPLTLAGAPMRAMIPIANTAGNVPVTFAALSYAGTLWLTVLSDPDQVPDVATLTTALHQELPAALG